MVESAPPSSSPARGPTSSQTLPPGARIEALVSPGGAPAAQPLEELISVLEREIGASSDLRETAELKVRAALLEWDGRGHVEKALRLIQGVDHPVALSLRLQVAIDAESDQALAAYADEALRRGDAEEMAELGELLLFRGDHPRATALLTRSGEGSRLLRAFALLRAGRYAEAVEALSVAGDAQALLLSAHLAEDRMGDAERARVLLRRLLEKPPAGGISTQEMARVIERLMDLEQRRPGEAGRVDLLRRKLELLGGVPAIEAALERPHPAHAEIMGSVLLIAQCLERSGAAAAAAEAAGLLAIVSRYCQACPAGQAALFVNQLLRTRARLHILSGNYMEGAQLLVDLGDRIEAACAELGEEDRLGPLLHAVGVAHLRRAAELHDAYLAEQDSGRQAISLYTRLCAADPVDAVLPLLLSGLLIARGRTAEAVEALDAYAVAVAHQRPQEVVHAMRAAEALRDARGARRWGSLEDIDAHGTEALVRHHRRRADRPGLIAAYVKLASALHTRGDAQSLRRAAAYRAVAGALALEALSAREAEVILFQQGPPGGAAEPGALLIQLARVLLLRRQARYKEAGAALVELIPHVKNLETQTALYRQLACLAAEHMGDAELARRSYLRVLELHPQDVVALHALGRLVSEENAEEGAVLLGQAVDAALRLPPGPNGETGGKVAAILLCEIGALHSGASLLRGARPGTRPSEPPLRPRDLERAIESYELALRHDATCRQAAFALCALHRTGGQGLGGRRYLAALEHALGLCKDDGERLPLLWDHGLCAESLAEAPDAGASERLALKEKALLSYGRLLDIDPAHEQTLARFEQLSRSLDRLPPLFAALERAPRTRARLRSLCELCERLDRPADLARLREEELAFITDGAELLGAARALAELHQHRLGDARAAARLWERVYDLDPESALAVPGVAAALERVFVESGRHAHACALWTREIQRIDQVFSGESSELSRQELIAKRRELLLKLGVAQRDHLGDRKEALAAFERVLRDHPEDAAALEALSTLYTDQEQLRHVLSLRMKSAQGPEERSHVLIQSGAVREQAGDLAEAEQAFAEAYYLAPGNRTAFTSLERVLYRLEKWPEVMRMYDTAIRLVEEHKSRAYRLGDLLARRGQVLLAYLGKPEEAARDYLQALEHDADNDAVQQALERIYAGSGSWRSLIEAYERRATLLRDDGKRVEVLRRAARVALAKLRDVKEAIRIYQQLHAVDPTDAEALDALERHFEKERDHEALVSLLGTRLALASSEADTITLNMRIAVICEEALRDHERAIECYRQVLEIQPAHRDALDALARLFEANERWSELIEVSRRQIRLTTDRTQKALLYFKCGSVMEAKFQKDDDAIRYYEAAVKTSPSCLPALHGLRDIYIRREEWPRVTQTLELEAKLWTEDKERAGIYAHIGNIYKDKLHDLDRAIQYYESALSVDKDCLPANRALFDVFFERGDWARAVPMTQVLSAKVQREGEPALRSDFHRRRAVVAEHVGDRLTAIESLVVALEIQPENRDALSQLVSLCRRDSSGYDFATPFRELEKLYRRRDDRQLLAQALCALSVIAERAYDVEQAERMLGEAVLLSPLDYSITDALVSLDEKLRRFAHAGEVLLRFIAARAQGELDAEALMDLVRAKLRLAEMYSEAAMEPEHALQVLSELCESHGQLQRTDKDARPLHALLRLGRFRLIQEQYLLGRYADARKEMQTLIEQAESPPPGERAGSMAPPEELARYYDYLGRILEALGEGAAAQRNYRRAMDIDPTHAPAVLALARRAQASGDRAQAEALIAEALAQVRRPHEELRLRRGVARLLSVFDPEKAIEAYRRTIHFATSLLSREEVQVVVASAELGGPQEAVARETLDDRVALADLHMRQGNLVSARDELLVSLQRDIRHAPVYPLLAEVYERLGQSERAARLHTALTLLGYGDGRSGLALPRPGPRVSRGLGSVTLSDEQRQRSLWLPALRSPYLELLQTLSEHLSAMFPPPWPPHKGAGGESSPASRVADAGFKICMSDAMRLLGVEAEIVVARGVPGGVLTLEAAGRPGAAPLPQVLIEASLLDRSDGERRFLLGRALEPLRSGYAVMLRLRPKELGEIGALLEKLLRPESERDAAAQEFFRSLPKKAQKGVERLVGSKVKIPGELFLQALSLTADRAGLLVCDDIFSAVRMMARLQGEELSSIDGLQGGAVLLGQVRGGAELLRYFLSDAYDELCAALRGGQQPAGQ